MRVNINREVAPTALMTLGDLVNHYRQTELLADNKTDKTRTTYLVYLRKWILPKWEREYLHNIKPIVVEQWLRSLDHLSGGSKSKIRNITSGGVVTRFGMGWQTETPLPRCDRRAPIRHQPIGSGLRRR